MKKSQIILQVAIVILLIVLGFEVYVLFFQKMTPLKPIIIKSASKPIANANLYLKRTDSEVKRIQNTLSKKTSALQPLIKSGVVKELLLTETFKTVVTQFESTSFKMTFEDGSTATFVYRLKFSTMSSEGKKDFEYPMTKEEVERITTFKTVGEDEVPIELLEIKPGDFVSITVEEDIPTDSIVSMKIVKLL